LTPRDRRRAIRSSCRHHLRRRHAWCTIAEVTDAFHRLHGAVADAAPAPAGPAEQWDYSDGTAPGGAEAMSEPDAVIVQRIRALCPDNRFEGSSDVELLQLFRRNKRVLARSDEDVIAAMVQ
jgi:hypothetical protein